MAKDTKADLNKRILSLEVQLEKANERAKSDNPLTSGRAEATVNRLTNDIMRLQGRLDAMGKSSRTSKRAPELTDSGRVNAPPRPRSEREGKELASNAAERRYGSGPDRPSTVDTQSKKPIAKRIMEALGDNRSMEQATRDREMNKEMEEESKVAGRKKGGMVKKKKAPVKKAYGGTVKKKQGGSTNKVNMKAGFTRRGCVKG
jgi:hypothetical protein